MLKFKIIKTLEDCEKLWKAVSPNKILWDVWETNVCFYDPKLYDLHFIAGYEGARLVGLLPLWFDIKQKYFGFFGGDFPEQRSFFIDDTKLVQQFIEQVPGEFCLTYIKLSELEFIRKYEPGVCDVRYYFDLRKVDFSLEKLFASFNKKHRKNLRYDLKQLEKLGYCAEFGRAEDFDKLVEFNVQRFGKESDLADKSFVLGMKKLVDHLDKNKMLHVISVIVDGRVEGVEIAALYDGTYYVLNGGCNPEIKNLGKLLIVEHIKNAILLKADVIDFLSGDAGWKKLWNCEEEVLYEI